MTARTARRKVTLEEIARAAQVSKSTVSLVLKNSPNAIPISDATSNRVLEVAERLGYRGNAAARSLATGRSYTVLLVAFDLWDEDLVERVRGVEACLVPQGYSTLMCTVDAKGGFGAYSEILRSGQADGVLLAGLATRETYPVLSQLRAEADNLGLPIVAMANAFPRELVTHVAHIEDRRGAEEVVSHLVNHGHRRILMLRVADQGWCDDREQGYRSALSGAGVAVEPGLIVQCSRGQRCAYEATLELTRSMDFTAVFAANDHLAIAAMSALRTAGRRIPEDCAVVGFDNNEQFAAYTDPPLTTVENPFCLTGETAARMLLELIEKGTTSPRALPVSLVVRQSCGCSSRPEIEQKQAEGQPAGAGFMSERLARAL